MERFFLILKEEKKKKYWGGEENFLKKRKKKRKEGNLISFRGRGRGAEEMSTTTISKKRGGYQSYGEERNSLERNRRFLEKRKVSIHLRAVRGDEEWG